jgi:hypothetical protein
MSLCPWKNDARASILFTFLMAVGSVRIQVPSSLTYHLFPHLAYFFTTRTEAGVLQNVGNSLSDYSVTSQEAVPFIVLLVRPQILHYSFYILPYVQGVVLWPTPYTLCSRCDGTVGESTTSAGLPHFRLVHRKIRQM